MPRNVAASPHARTERDITTPRYREGHRPNGITPRRLAEPGRPHSRAQGLLDPPVMATSLDFQTQRPSITLVHALPDRPRDRERPARRLLNTAVAAGALIVTAPLTLLIATLIKLTSRGPVLFTQTRVGLDRRALSRAGGNTRRRMDLGGSPFTIYKFRTMRVAPASSDREVWARPDDARITAIGRVLRKFRLDELPQLFNVLRGEMNIVGPRPDQTASTGVPRRVGSHTAVRVPRSASSQACKAAMLPAITYTGSAQTRGVGLPSHRRHAMLARAAMSPSAASAPRAQPTPVASAASASAAHGNAHGTSQRHSLWLASIQANRPQRSGLSSSRSHHSVRSPLAMVRTFRRYSWRSDALRGTKQIASGTDTARKPRRRASSAAPKSRLRSSGTNCLCSSARIAYRQPDAPTIPDTCVSRSRTHIS